MRAEQGAGAGESRCVGSPAARLATRRRLVKADGVSDAGVTDLIPTKSPSLCSKPGPRALHLGRPLPTRRLRIVDKPSSAISDDRRNCLGVLKGGLCPNVTPTSETAADDTTETWPPPPVRERLNTCTQRCAVQRRRRGRLAASTPAAALRGSGVVIDYAHALRFVMRVKSTCSAECFPAFLTILLAYHSGSRTVSQVYEQASALFAEQVRGDEVLAAFRDFLPEQ